LSQPSCAKPTHAPSSAYWLAPGMEFLQRVVARLCGRLPGKAGLYGYGICCILPCRALHGCRKRDDPESARGDARKPALRNMGERRVLICGLDNSGKSSFLWMCEHPSADELPTDEITSTSGVLRLTRKDVHSRDDISVDLDFCEIGGDERLRPFWSRYVSSDIRVLAFFIDASKHERLQEAAAQFASIAAAARQVAPRIKMVLVASRTDLPGALAADEVHAQVLPHLVAVPGQACAACVQLPLSRPGARSSAEAVLAKLAAMAL